MKVLMSIKPKYADKIFSGEKCVEYRRTIWRKKGVDTVIVYVSAPISKVVGEFKISPYERGGKGLLLDTIWFMTKSYSGITEEEFYKYFEGKHRGHTIPIKSYTKYDTPRPLSDYGLTRPPQNFMYLKESL
jgi:predicted transcriptional regulator